MKKVLIVTRNFPPLLGGMERLNRHMAEELFRYCEVRLIAPQGAAEHVSGEMAVRQIPVRPLSRFLLKAAWQTLREARTWKPDIILAGSGLTAPLALIAARASKAKAVAYVHGLDLTAPHPVYRALWLPLMKKLDGLIANSRPTQALAEEIGALPERIRIVHPGVSLTPPDPAARSRFRASRHLGEGPILLSVGRLTARKGLREFVTDALPQIVAQFPDVQLTVIGDVPKDSLHAEDQSIESIAAAAQQAGVEKNLRFLGKLSDAELADAYAGANLHVFPIRFIPNNPEGFGMVAIEAAAQGLATVAYATGGVVDAVSEGESGLLVEPGNADAFSKAVAQLLRQPFPAEQIRAFAAKFDWSSFGAQVFECLKQFSAETKHA